MRGVNEAPAVDDDNVPVPANAPVQLLDGALDWMKAEARLQVDPSWKSPDSRTPHTLEPNEQRAEVKGQGSWGIVGHFIVYVRAYGCGLVAAYCCCNKQIGNPL